jgi:hypothetical protein
MNEEDTANAVRSVLKDSEIDVPEDLLGAISGSTGRVSYEFGYFNGRKVITSVHTFQLTVETVRPSDKTYIAELYLDGEAENFVIQSESIRELRDEIADIQNVVIV